MYKPITRPQPNLRCRVLEARRSWRSRISATQNQGEPGQLPLKPPSGSGQRPRSGRGRLSYLLAGVALISAMACGAGAAQADRYSRKEAKAELARLDNKSLVIGVFALDRVVDGDTLRVDGLGHALRLVGLDAEETFKHEADRRDAAGDW